MWKKIEPHFSSFWCLRLHASTRSWVEKILFLDCPSPSHSQWRCCDLIPPSKSLSPAQGAHEPKERERETEISFSQTQRMWIWNNGTFQTRRYVGQNLPCASVEHDRTDSPRAQPIDIRDWQLMRKIRKSTIHMITAVLSSCSLIWLMDASCFLSYYRDVVCAHYQLLSNYSFNDSQEILWKHWIDYALCQRWTSPLRNHPIHFTRDHNCSDRHVIFHEYKNLIRADAAKSLD